MSVNAFNLADGQIAERKKLLHVAEWKQADGRFYVVQTSEPFDWKTNYTSYYTRSGSAGSYTYEAVTGTTAPTWAASTYYTRVEREILGTRTPDSSIDFNTDVSTETDIRGNTYTDINKTEPTQAFDQFLVMGGARLNAVLHDISMRNALTELNQFTVYTIYSYIGNAEAGYSARKDVQCTIEPQSLGGDTKVNFPNVVHYSNNLTVGTVNKLADDFEFTPDVTV